MSKKERDKRYYEKNKERLRERAKLYGRVNRKKKSEYMKEYYQRKKETIKEYQRKHRVANKDEINRREREINNGRVAWLWQLKSTLSCIQCGEQHPACLDFHHRSSEVKKGTIGKLINHATLAVVIEEIKKCDVLCANCHRKLHWQQGNRHYKQIVSENDTTSTATFV